MQIEKIEFGSSYHIFNRGNNSQNIFFEEENYAYFLKLLDKYILPIADIYCYCLMQNHFHLLVRIKEFNELRSADFQFSTVEKPKTYDASRQFAHFFNAYTLAINKRYGRTGSLLEKPFERKLIETADYFLKMILYIHNNPKRHGIVAQCEDYRWSSYRSIVSGGATKIKRVEVLAYFDDVENFIYCHRISD